MSRCSLTITWTITALASVFTILPYCYAQVGTRQKPRPQKVMRQLHPELVENDSPMGIRLLVGYKHKSATDFEGNQVGEISKSEGVKIKYEIGFSQGSAIDPSRRVSYVWYREQKVGGRVIRYALNKNNLLIINVPFSDDPNSLYAANFYAKTKKPEDVADMLLMILPFAYK